MKRSLLTITLLLVCLGMVAAQDAPPPTPIRVVTDNYFGSKIDDPYRYLEDLKDPNVVAWFKAQNDYTRRLLARIPGREKLYNRILELDTASVKVNALQIAGGRYFYRKQPAEANSLRLYVRDGLNGAERVLVDPDKLTANGVHQNIDWYVPSLDGRLVAAGIAAGGSENAILHVFDSVTGKELPDKIERTQFGALTWREDGNSFYYHRLRQLGPGEPVPNRYLKSAIYLHVLGTDPEKDPKIAGYGLSKDVSISETDVPILQRFPGSRWMLLFIAHGVQNEYTVYYAPDKDVSPKGTPWKKLLDVDDEVTSFEVHGDDFYFLSHKGASRFKMMRVHLPATGLSKAEVLIPQSEMVLREVRIAKDAAYVSALDGGIGRVWRAPYGGKVQQLKLPIEGAIEEMFGDPRLEGVVLRMSGWTTSPTYFAYSPSSNTTTDTGLIPPSPVDFSGITSEEVKAKAAEGTEIPLSIIHKRGIALDGTHPTVLHGYGSYGISMDPAFNPANLAWLEHGGVIAFAHVRGGGEYGEDWHLGGKKSTKMNTITDFIACAEYLVARKFTSPPYLAGEGTSAGGITIGGAITERPELFAAALDNVGMSDDLRAELQVNGPLNVVEFGTVKVEQEFRDLLKISAYHRVKDQTKYPAVLLTTGVNDPKVDPWQMAKMAARLQAATSSGRPVLLRVDYDGGHGFMGTTKRQRAELLADEMSFLLWQFGDPEFVPPANTAAAR